MTGLLELENLSVRFNVGGSLFGRFGNSSTTLTAVDSVTFSAEPGRSIGIVGESGCGKSTLAKALIGLVSYEGVLRFDGAELKARRTKQLRRQIQMVFQDPGSSLNPALTPRQTLSELLKIHEMVPVDAIDDRCAELIDLVELPARVLDVQPRSLSGGQRQRIGLARALALEPSVLIADESVAALDVSVQASILNLISDLKEELNLTLLFISHDLAVIRHMADEVVVMYLGGMVEHGSVAEVFDDPQHPYTQALLASAPRLKRDLTDETPIIGEPPSPLDLPPGCRFAGRCPQAFDLCHTERPPLYSHDHGSAACFLLSDSNE